MVPVIAVAALVSVSAVAPPAGTQAAYTAIGRGVQVYNCQLQSGEPAWTFVQPEAQLFDVKTKKLLGTHGAGPHWTFLDGSSIVGRLQKKSPAPDGKSVPWLLLQADHTGATSGALSAVTWVARTDTHGGSAPAKGCNAKTIGLMTRVRYTAQYTFYKEAQ